ncbi:helix-turn-helix domain-containing protein [Psychromonas sp. 14N.309.X.WAT.B.A12]|uniref:helix-turn-helix domain-containing protein n=1 Tax=Psychromonas sp. 14N.309.X.WAT.B.A12 TaxID=2998322 RepID=UPI0025AF3BCD|nr:helix-turn-helix domain-containing protein [Psychromonas sp. 14N.309.X.WAT.B.A12]MDN2663643.1 helix-turn-helix domain-containing protein [Psychromonas sp. 14N.309.X.WAT.B.A12]
MTLDQALKEHRIAANFSVEELALKLNLKASVVNDIENDLELLIADKRYPVIYLRGYLANYAKAVQLAEIESFSEYQQLSIPSRSNNTLSNPYLLSTKKKSSNKFGWFILIVFIAAIAGTISEWDNIVDALYTETSVDTENIHMRLPDPEHTNLIDPLNQQAMSATEETPTAVAEPDVSASEVESATEAAPE